MAQPADARVWAPSRHPGGGNPPWQLTADGDYLTIVSGAELEKVALVELETVEFRWGVRSSAVRLKHPSAILLRGLSRKQARELQAYILSAREQAIERARVAKLVAVCEAELPRLVAWSEGFAAAAAAHLREQGWLTRELVADWESSRPGGRIAELLSIREVRERIYAQQSEDVRAVLDRWGSSTAAQVQLWNEQFYERETRAHQSFFDNVEKSPLTDEQIRAVVCLDNRVQLIAAAGSGKTSVMVAKAGYAVYRNFVRPEHVLMLAFNATAAAELQQRVADRLAPLGQASEKIVARTFHSFGLSVIGRATGRKPSLAPWVEHSGGDIEKLASIVEGLRKSDPAFRTEWDLFRMVFGRDLPEFGQEEAEPEAWDAANRRDGFRTLAGEVVRSQGERLIADWLFYNGVNYVYEGRYEIDTADSEHRQYQPDFYYPDASLYHEHFALDSEGKPPVEFVNYLEGVQWKRRVHEVNGTALVETTMSELWRGVAFDRMAEALSARGVELAPDPNRVVAGQPPVDNARLVATFRSFMVHAKSNRISDQNLASLIVAPGRERFRFRHSRFVNLYTRIRDKWQEELDKADCIDFEDMLNFAADHVESGAYASPFRLVMVDEMQDASAGRARLVRALVAASDRRLFAVGDDWQSINRFAGADMSVMTGFEKWFGAGEVMRLERTFRCPQSLCDVSSTFVTKNPQQLNKTVVSSSPEHPPTMTGLVAAADSQVASVISDHLDAINSGIASGEVSPARSGRVTVFILGRYRHQAELMPRDKLTQWVHLDVRFSTIHASKGLEADYVVIPGMVRDRSAFPSRVADDPVLQLAMPVAEPFRYAEERRLLYVALTRARRAVTLVTVENRESTFFVELFSDGNLAPTRVGGTSVLLIRCPSCETGVMVQRNGKYGRFHSCSNFPACKQKMTEVDVASRVRERG
jgi:DNA helicase-4